MLPMTCQSFTTIGQEIELGDIVAIKIKKINKQTAVKHKPTGKKTTVFGGLITIQI